VGEVNLVLIGGIGDSGKSEFARSLANDPGIETLRVSDEFRDTYREVYGFKLGEKLGAEVVNEDWKSRAEPAAVRRLIDKIRQKKMAGSCRTLVLNSHFATYSPGGFMAGLDPQSLKDICVACDLIEGGKTGRGAAAIVLVDISISDVLRRRKAVWQSKPAFSMGFALNQDLEFNRLYALQYYSTLSSLVGAKRVSYWRVVLDWPEEYISKSIDQNGTFHFQLSELKNKLTAGGVIGEAREPAAP
jgi:hypothetical protein